MFDAQDFENMQSTLKIKSQTRIKQTLGLFCKYLHNKSLKVDEIWNQSSTGEYFSQQKQRVSDMKVIIIEKFSTLIKLSEMRGKVLYYEDEHKIERVKQDNRKFVNCNSFFNFYFSFLSRKA